MAASDVSWGLPGHRQRQAHRWVPTPESASQPGYAGRVPAPLSDMDSAVLPAL